MQTRILFSVVLISVSTLLARCGTPDTASQAQVAASTATVVPATTPLSIAGAPSYDIIRSLSQAVAQAQVIVIGTITGVGSTSNSARDSQDHSKPAANLFNVRQEHFFRVESYLKGSSPTDITIEQVEGAIGGPSAAVTQADIERAKAAYGAIPLKVGTRYLLLLNSRTDASGRTYYGGAYEPWRFELQTDGTGALVTPGHVRLSLPENFIPQPDAPFIPQIEQIIAAQQAGKP